MTTINEEVAAQLALKDYLEADTTLMGMINGVALRSVSSKVPTPFVKIDRQDASDLMVINGSRVWAELTYLVRGIAQGPDWATVQAIADQLDTILHRQAVTDAVVGIRDIIRLESFTDETIEAGELYVHAGGIYRLVAQQP